MVDAKLSHPRPALPAEAPRQGKEWPKAELADERASSVLEQMMTDLKPGNARAAKITGDEGVLDTAGRPTPGARAPLLGAGRRGKQGLTEARGHA